MKKLVAVLVACFVLTVLGHAQNARFTADKTQFLQELKAYLATASSKEGKAAAEKLMTDFEPVWNTRMDAASCEKAIALYELMRSKTGSRAYDNIFAFTESILQASQSGFRQDDLSRWMGYTYNRFSTRLTNIDKYVTQCRLLFADHVLNEKSNIQWIAQGGEMHFPTDTAFVVSVSTCDLVLKSAKDQSVIHGTQGLFFMDSHTWIGKDGRVDWSRFGIPDDIVYGMVHDYQVNTLSSTYSIEAIDFYNKDYFNHAVVCDFEDAVTNAAPNAKTAFPKATSRSGSYETGRLFDDIVFMGGFGMVGKSVNIFGDSQMPAQVIFSHDDDIVLRVRSKKLILSDNDLVSNQTSARIYLYDSLTREIDSIYHNDLGFRYDHNKRTVMLFRKDNGVGTGPFHDTYHEYDIFLEAVYWNRNEDRMEFRRLEGASGVSEGSVSSVNYFRKSDYLKIQALDQRHPMEHINDFLKIYGDEYHRFNINDFVSYIKYPLSQVTTLILSLQSQGYLEYDKDTQMVWVLDRFFDVLASDHDAFDFDVIKFQTRAYNRQPNISLMLHSNDMIVYGIYGDQTGSDVPSITLSDYKHVVILPDNGRIVLKKHRDFNFSGCIMAGMYEFFTKDCLFSYNGFSIEMKKVDSLRFYARFNGRVYPVEATLERLSGTLSIDESDNKSSVRETPSFPKFVCPGNSYKFYRTINGGVFDIDLPRDSVSAEVLDGRFYFCLDPFAMESLDNLNAEDIAFKGRLVSGGIFPDIRESLVVMEDHSLGFRHVIGNGNSDRYPIYGGKGSFHQELQLSNEGFFGRGKMDVETSEYASDRFDFYLDSVTAAVQSFAMRERYGDVPFPKAACGPLTLKWDVTIPQLYAVTSDEPIRMYDNTYFRGKTMLSDQGLRGDGVLTFGLTRFESDHFEFDTRSFVADSSDFVLYDEDGTTRAFLAMNYRVHVDFPAKTVRYDYLGQDSHLDFPLNQFYCSLQEAEWDMHTNRIHLYSAPSKFVSLLPEHDSLSFFSTNADYDMDEYVIHAHDVKDFRVADAEVVPIDANIDILRNAQIRPLEHALIVADTATHHHLFKDASVTVQSRHQYQAEGIKDYLDVNGVATPIHFSHIAPEGGITVGTAVIDDANALLLSPYFAFKGNITSSANEPNDYYDGYFRLTQSCLEDTVWFVSQTRIDPEEVAIPVDMKAVRDKRQGLFNGLCYEFGSGGGYRVNFMKPMNPETVSVLMQNGLLTYDVEQTRYRMVDTVHEDHWLELSDQCVVTQHGATDMGFDMGLTEMTSYGTFTSFPNDSVVMEVLNVFNAPVFDDQILHDMAEVYGAVEGEAVDLNETGYVDFLRFAKGDEKAEELQQEIELTGYPEIKQSDFYNQTIVIPSLKMVWNPQLRAFVSVGKIGLGSFGKHVVNRYVDGFVVFDRRLGVITYFFENDLFMTFLSYNCADGQLQVHATWGTVNSRLSEMKERKRMVKSDGKEFEYVVTPYEAMTDFLSKLRRAGLR